MTAQSANPALAAKTRADAGRNLNALRAQGMLPAVMYGHNKTNTPLTLDAKEFLKVLREAGQTTLVALKVDDNSAVKVLIHDIQTDPVRRTVKHVDFYAVNLKEKLRTEVPLTFEGVADAVEILGGTLITVQDAVEVECLPDDLIHEITVDLSKLKTFDDTITVADLTVPESVTIMDEMDQTLISVAEPRSEEEMAALDEVPEAEVATEFETKDGAEAAEGEGDGEKSAETAE